jgi:plastocyanin
MKTKFIAILLIISISVVITISGCVQTSPQQQTQPAFGDRYVTDENKTVEGDVVVTITADGFSPSNLRIPVNTTVIWYNKDTKSHSVYIPVLKKGSISINDGRSWSLKFNKTGEYPYYCQFYIDLKANITVY